MYHVVFARRPFLEYLQRETGVKHAGRGEHDHGARILDVRPIERFDVLELEHVSLNERLSYLLIGPRNEQLIVIGGLKRKASNANFIHAVRTSS